MATLGTLPGPGSRWALTQPLDGYSRPRGSGLATQIQAGRHLKVLEKAVVPPRQRGPAAPAGAAARGWLPLLAGARRTAEPGSAGPPARPAPTRSQPDRGPPGPGAGLRRSGTPARPTATSGAAPWARTSTAQDWSRPPSPRPASGCPAMPTCRSASAGPWPCAAATISLLLPGRSDLLRQPAALHPCGPAPGGRPLSAQLRNSSTAATASASTTSAPPTGIRWPAITGPNCAEPDG